MRRLVPLAVLLALAALAPSPSFADGESDRVTCFSLGNENHKDAGKFDIGLAACSRMIDSGRKDKGLASIYRARASWKEKKRDLDAALQEYDRATKIDPTYAAAYYSRGQVYEKKGDLDKARARLKALAEGGAKQEPVK
jgi:tetratricopeptide (TPR) repeat protein